MPKLSTQNQLLAIAEALTTPFRSTAPTPAASLKASTPKPAVRRCCAAWQCAFDAYMRSRGSSLAGAQASAELPAAAAYCNAMPILSDFDGIRDFIACTAHGVPIVAIPKSKAGLLLYAA